MSRPDDHDGRPQPESHPRREASEAQRAASRANGARSRGPATPEGLARSRTNAVKHGLTGKGDILPPDLAADAADRFDTYLRALRPEDAVQRDLVRRAALASVRLEYAEHYQAARLSQRARSAESDWDDRRAAEVDEAARQLDADPAAALRRLERIACGAQWLIDRWEELGRAVEQIGHWDEPRIDRAARLLGYATRPDCAAAPEAAALVRHALGAMAELPEPALRRYFGEPEPREEGLDDDYDIDIGPPPTYDDGVAVWTPPPPSPPTLEETLRLRLPSAEAARDHLAAFVAAEVERLAALRDPLPERVDAPQRAEAVDLALFDPGPEAARLRQYEWACERERSRALADLERLKKAKAAAGEVESPPQQRENEPGAPAAAPPDPRPSAAAAPAAMASASWVEPRRENEPGAPAPMRPSGPPMDAATGDEGPPESPPEHGATPGG
jgi:hypothetical protein